MRLKRHQITLHKFDSCYFCKKEICPPCHSCSRPVCSNCSLFPSFCRLCTVVADANVTLDEVVPQVESSKDAVGVGVEKNLLCSGYSGQLDCTYCEGCSQIICRDCSPYGFCPGCEIRPQEDSPGEINTILSVGKEVLFTTSDEANQLEKIRSTIKIEVSERLLNASEEKTD